MVKKFLASFALVTFLGIGGGLFINENQVDAAEVTGPYSYLIPASQVPNIYHNIQGDSSIAKAMDLIQEYVPFGGIIANDGFSTKDRQELEKAYHNNSALVVTVDPGSSPGTSATSYTAK